MWDVMVLGLPLAITPHSDGVWGDMERDGTLAKKNDYS
jgi:hypothetical protein